MKTIRLRVKENNVTPSTVIEGISPVLSFEEVEGGISMTSTDHNGTQTVLIPQGPKGDKGDKGDIGSLTPEELEIIGDQATEALQNEISAKLNIVDAAATYTTKEELQQHIQDTADIYARKNNTVITGSLSLGRVEQDALGEDAVIGEGSTATGISVDASGVASHAEGNETISSGNGAHAEGYHARAEGEYSHAEGVGQKPRTTWRISNVESFTAVSAGRASHTEGYFTGAYGEGDHAEGAYTYANGTITPGGITSGAHAEGFGTRATASYAHAEGSLSKATGVASHAEGGSVASNARAHAEGSSTASGNAAHSEGLQSTSSGTASHAEGANSEATGTYSHAEGQGTIASGLGTHAEGTYNYDRTIDDYGAPEWVSGDSYSVGDQVRQWGSIYMCVEANSDTSFNSWKWTTVKTSFAHVVGNARSQYVDRSNAYALDWEGNGMYMGDVYVHADAHSENGEKLATEGYVTGQVNEATAGMASETYVSEQIQSAMEEKSGEDEDKFALKDNTVLTGSLSLGRKADTTVGSRSVALGNSVTASGSDTFAEGYKTTASGSYSHASGNESSATGQASFAEGEKTIASAWAAHAEGWTTVASAMAAHAEGTITEASGAYAHAEGQGTVASGDASHSEGRFNYNRTIEDYPNVAAWSSGSSYNAGALVKYSGLLYEALEYSYNIKPSSSKSKWKVIYPYYFHMVGNGYNASNRSNAYALDGAGNGMYMGDVYVHADAHSENGEKVATEAYVQARIAEAIAQLTAQLSATVTDTQDANGGIIRTITAPMVAANGDNEEASGT